MKKFLIFCSVIFAQIAFAQNVILNKVEKVNTNSDKIFYKIDPKVTSAEYLGEIEVQGFSDDDAKVFGLIYKKAKEIGANSFSYKPVETITGENSAFDELNYRLNLYYVPKENVPAENNVVYLISSPFKKQKIAVNKENIEFEPRTFKKVMLKPGENYTISTRKLLGSAITLSAQENQPVQYFQFSAFSINSNPYGTAGINLKSGDITKLEQSYAQFLTTIYKELK